MNSKMSLLIISSTTLLIGLLLYAIQYQWIIFRGITPLVHIQQHIKTKKICTFYYWHNNRWNTESQELIWSVHPQENLMTIVAHWLSLLDAEQLLPKRVTLQSATLTPTKQEAYLSFDHNLLPKEWSTYRKLMLIEGLLKTIRSNPITLKNIYILVHHQPLLDAHLDFSCAWPITGYLTT